MGSETSKITRTIHDKPRKLKLFQHMHSLLLITFYHMNLRMHQI